MKNWNVSSKLVLVMSALLVVSCTPKGFQTNQEIQEMNDTSEAIPEVLTQEIADDQEAKLQDQIDQQQIQATPVAEKEEVQIDPTLGYKLVVVVDRAKQGTTKTAQRLAIFKWNEETESFELFNQDLWKVSTGVQIPITETITNKSDGTVKVVTSQRFTPTGFYAPNVIDAKARSNSYQADMPNAVWFIRERGYAIHATGKSNYRILGQRASHGCIRLTLDHSKILFNLVKDLGRQMVVSIDHRTGKPVVNRRREPVFVKRYPVLVIVNDATDKLARARFDLSQLVEEPSQVIRFFE